MATPDQAQPEGFAEALAAAMNAHDIDAFASLFAEDYESQQPAHPDRAFVGSGRVRDSWSSLFADVPDLRAELVRTAVDADTVWIEWRWHGTYRDGGPFDVAGVVICGVHEGQMTWARLYMEPVDSSAATDT